MKRAVVTGADGFLMGYLVMELLQRGYAVTGIDGGARYGDVFRAYTQHQNYRGMRADAGDPRVLQAALVDADYFVMGAALVGGVGYFHRYPYDIFAGNERLTLAGLDAAIEAQAHGRLQRTMLLSSSMVYENCATTPFREGDQLRSPPPSTAYGLQKLAAEQACIAAHEQYGLCYTIIRPFNCVGIGEVAPTEVRDAFARHVWDHAATHVVPDLVLKALVEPGPLRILGDGMQIRHFTHGYDLACGMVSALESSDAANQDFNLANAQGTSMLDLARTVWSLCRPGEPFAVRSEPTYQHDVRVRVPDTGKASAVLGWRATTTLEASVAEFVDWVRAQL